MKRHHKLTTIVSTIVLLLLRDASPVSGCPPECDCTSNSKMAICSNQDLESLPSGNWPLIQHLVVDNNNIEKLTEDMLAAFPNLETLIMNDNIMNELRLEAFTVLKNLTDYTCNNCDIQKVVPLPADKQLLSLKGLYLRNTSINDVPQSMLSGVGTDNLALDMSDNELVVPGGRPFLSSTSLQRLTLAITDCSKISADTFSELPNLKLLDLTDSEIVVISYQFSSLKNLQILVLEENPFSEIKGDLPSDLTALKLGGSGLENIDVNDMDRMTKLKYIDITDTPMACNCGYKSVYDWANSRHIGFDASCDNSSCTFHQKI